MTMPDPSSTIQNVNCCPPPPPAARLRVPRAYLAAGLVIAVGLLLSLGVFCWDYHQRKTSFQQKFESEAKERIAAIEQSCAAAELVLDSVRRFYAGSQKVEPDEFRTFVGPYFGRVPGLEMLGWVPWDSAADQPVADQPPQDSVLRGDRLPQVRTPATPRQFPADGRVPQLRIRLAEPFPRAAELLDLDLGSLPEVRACLLRAADTGRAAVSSRVELPGDGPGRAHLLLAAPVYVGEKVPGLARARRAEMRGLVVGLIEIRLLLHDSLQHLSAEEQVAVWLLENAAPEGSCVLAVWPPEVEQSGRVPWPARDHALVVSRTIPLDAHGLRVVCVPRGKWSGLRAVWRSWAVLCLGLGLTAALAAYLLATARQRAGLDAACRELQQAHASLVEQINQRSAAEERLAALNRRHEAILGAVPEMICQVDCQKRYTWANQAALDFFGADMIGREAAEYFVESQDTQEKVQPLFEGSDEVVYVESWQRRRDGQKRLLAWWCRALKDEQGRVVGALSTARDITDQRRAQQQLADEKAFTDYALNTVQDAFYVLDSQGHFLRWNRRLEEVSGYGPEEIPCLRPADFFVPEDCPRIVDAIQRAWQGEHVRLEAEGLTKDGRRIPFELTASRLADAEGNTIAVCGLARDMVERKRNEQQLHDLADELQLRIRQMNCLHGISRVLEEGETSGESLARRSVKLLPSAFRHPHSACARITLFGQVEQTAGFQETSWRVTAPIVVDGQSAGAVDVCYREMLPGRDEGPFLAEEKGLVEEVAQRLGTVLSRMRADERVRELKQRMEFILGATRTGMAVLDDELRVHYVDPESLRSYGDPAGKTCCEYFCGRSEACEQCGSLQALNEHRTLVAERKLPKEDNRPVQVTSIPFQDEQGRWWIAQVSADISQRKKAEAALRASEARHRAITQSAQDAIITADPTGTVRFWNSAAERTFGFTAEEAVGRNMMHLIVPPEYHEAKRRGMALFARTGRGAAVGKTLELEGLRKDGSRFPIEISVSAYPGEDGFVGVALVRDISQRKQLEGKLHQGRKMEAVGQLAAGIAHEINTPIQYVGDNMRFVSEAFEEIQSLFQALVELLAGAHADKLDPALVDRLQQAVERADLGYLAEEIPRAMQQGLEGVGRVADIVRAMKEFAHPGGEQKQVVDLNRAVQNTLIISRNEWKYVAEAETCFDPELPPVPCLPGELNQVLLNLIVNAAHAIGEKNKDKPEARGTITVSTRRHGRWAEIAVADTGTGISPEIASQVFNPFFTTKEPGHGTGQGLAIAHHIIVDKHGGRIDFESEVGRGAVFTVRLPLEEESAQPLEPEEPAGAVSTQESVEALPLVNRSAGESAQATGAH